MCFPSGTLPVTTLWSEVPCGGRACTLPSNATSSRPRPHCAPQRSHRNYQTGLVTGGNGRTGFPGSQGHPRGSRHQGAPRPGREVAAMDNPREHCPEGASARQREAHCFLSWSVSMNRCWAGLSCHVKGQGNKPTSPGPGGQSLPHSHCVLLWRRAGPWSALTEPCHDLQRQHVPTEARPQW